MNICFIFSHHVNLNARDFLALYLLQVLDFFSACYCCIFWIFFPHVTVACLIFSCTVFVTCFWFFSYHVPSPCFGFSCTIFVAWFGFSLTMLPRVTYEVLMNNYVETSPDQSLPGQIRWGIWCWKKPKPPMNERTSLMMLPTAYTLIYIYIYISSRADGVMEIFQWLFVINRRYRSRWAIILSWLNYLFLAFDP